MFISSDILPLCYLFIWGCPGLVTGCPGEDILYPGFEEEWARKLTTTTTPDPERDGSRWFEFPDDLELLGRKLVNARRKKALLAAKIKKRRAKKVEGRTGEVNKEEERNENNVEESLASVEQEERVLVKLIDAKKAKAPKKAESAGKKKSKLTMKDSGQDGEEDEDEEKEEGATKKSKPKKVSRKRETKREGKKVSKGKDDDPFDV